MVLVSPAGASGCPERALSAKVRGWQWVVAELARIRGEAIAESERLLGPERGE